MARRFASILDVLDELAQSESDSGLSVTVNGEGVAIEISEVCDAAQCQISAIEFYDSALKDIWLVSPRNLTNAAALKAKAHEIEATLSGETAPRELS